MKISPSLEILFHKKALLVQERMSFRSYYDGIVEIEEALLEAYKIGREEADKDRMCGGVSVAPGWDGG